MDKYFSSVLVILMLLMQSCHSGRTETKILIFSQEEGNVLANQLEEVAGQQNWQLAHASNNIYFRDDSLAQYSAIIINVSDINNLNHIAMPALIRYLEAGGGGIVAIKNTALNVSGWPRLESAASNQKNTKYGNPEAFYFLEPVYNQEGLNEAIKLAIGKNQFPDYKKAITQIVPDSSRYTRITLTQGLNEPMEMEILPNNNVLFVERHGAIKLYDASQQQVKTIAHLEVFSGIEDGLLGVALDPDFSTNNRVYFYYAVPGDKWINRLSRMELKGDQLLLSSEKVMLEIPTQRKYCCHSAGYLAFGPDGLLYLSTGDNTNAEEAEGYIPIDERPGRELADDQGTAANSNDLRGKILRIKPEADGTYSIPDGNLFPKDGSMGKPEIYIMGSRNPYRFSIDPKTQYLYWGDIGPDTNVPGSEGTMSYDEINRAAAPGFYGWPYFLGANEAFPYYDFETKKEGAKFDPANPVNNSPNNTGIKLLPPPQPAMIWYGKGASRNFPLVGSGGASAMAGPVYYSELYPDAKFKLSPYYDGKLFVYDWVRRWILAVTMDENGNYLRMEPFLDHMNFVAPVDIKFGPDGAMYILEYGTNWFAKNVDAKLTRIEYSEGFRNPVANIEADHLYGAAPLKVNFSGVNSINYDKGGELSYHWKIEGKVIASEKVSHTFERSGIYNIDLTVVDGNKREGQASVTIKVGNAPPDVDIHSESNRTFYWDNASFDYKVDIKDREDKIIDPDQVTIAFNYLKNGNDLAPVLSGGFLDTEFVRGQQLTATLDCKACHSLNKESVGPAYSQIAGRYKGQHEAVSMLTRKIIEGGSGNWGTRPMSAHPDLQESDAREMAQYILSLANKRENLAQSGKIPLRDHIDKGEEGKYLFVASYKDKGANNIEPLLTREYVVLRNPLVQIEDFDEGDIRIATITTKNLSFGTGIRHNSYIKFNGIDLRHVKNLKFRVLEYGIGGNIEVRLGSTTGQKIASLKVVGGRDRSAPWKEVKVSLVPTDGVHDLYFVFTNPDAKQENLLSVDWIYFCNDQ